MAVKKLEIDIKDDYGYILLGIVSSLPDYILAHHINQAAQVDLKRYDDFEAVKGSKKELYSWFQAFFEEYKTKIFLLSNRSGNHRLLPSFKPIDYFLIIENEYDEELAKFLIQSVRKINKVTGIYKLDKSKISHPDIFFEKLEIHELETFKKNKPDQV